MDAFTPTSKNEGVEFCWQLILTFVGLKWLQGGGTGGQGLLNNIRSYLWIPVQQYTTREIQVSERSLESCIFMDLSTYTYRDDTSLLYLYIFLRTTLFTYLRNQLHVSNLSTSSAIVRKKSCGRFWSWVPPGRTGALPCNAWMRPFVPLGIGCGWTVVPFR